MSTTQLSDIIDVTVFQDLPAVNSPELTAFYMSGIVTRNPLLDMLANSPGKTAELPFWKDLDADSAPNNSTDDPTDIATADKIVQGEQIARKIFVNKGWSTSDLATELAMGANAMSQIRSRTDTYWTRQWQRYLLSVTAGVYASNVANNAGDMVIDVASESIAGQTSATKFSRSNFTATAFTLGDAFTATGAIAVHSQVYKQMLDQDGIDFIPNSEGKMVIPTYMGKRVIVDDLMTVTAGTTDGFKYTTILFGDAAIGYGDGAPINAVAVDRKEEQGNGAGIETLWNRKTYLIHPFGFQYTGTPADGFSPTMAELATAASWTRVIQRKNVPIAYLTSN